MEDAEYLRLHRAILDQMRAGAPDREDRSDPLNDPRFPNRPQHPDFWRLSAAVLKADGATEESDFDMTTYLSQYVDPESLQYLSTQRVARVAHSLDSQYTKARFMALYLDAFLAGVEFARSKE